MIYSPLRLLDNQSLSALERRHPAYQQKVEGPLTPPALPDPSAKAADFPSLPRCLADILPDLPSPIQSSSDLLSSDPYVKAFLDDQIHPIARQVEQEVEQEQLQEADSTKRVKILAMNWGTPVPPWEMYLEKKDVPSKGSRNELVQQMQLMNLMKSVHLESTYWRGAKRVERELRWTPFPLHLGRVVTQEDINDDQGLESYLPGSGPHDEVDSQKLIWKPDGLRILRSLHDQDTEEDEIDLITAKGGGGGGTDLISLLAKRKRQIREDDTNLRHEETMSGEKLSGAVRYTQPCILKVSDKESD